MHGQVAQVGGLEGQTVGVIALVAEGRRYVELGHDSTVVDGVHLYLVGDLEGVLQGFGYIVEDALHLFGRL